MMLRCFIVFIRLALIIYLLVFFLAQWIRRNCHIVVNYKILHMFSFFMFSCTVYSEIYLCQDVALRRFHITDNPNCYYITQVLNESKYSWNCQDDFSA